MGNLILIVDDDEVDQFMLERALRGIGVLNPIRKLPDGNTALHYLNGDPPYHDRTCYPFPGVIFLDLKMPRLTGFEVLEWLKTHPTFKSIPTIVLSSSDLQSDIDKAYSLGANAYLVKPADVDDFRRVFATTGQFFVELAETPSPQALA